MSGQVKIINCVTGTPATEESQAVVDGMAVPVNYWPWIAAAAVLTVVFGAVFFVNLRSYLRLQKEAGGIAGGQGVVKAGEEAGSMNRYGTDAGTTEKAAYLQPQGYEATAAIKPSDVRTQRDEQAEPGIYVGKVHDIGRRSSQQDSFGISQDGSRLDGSKKGVFAIVADGMGGLSNGGAVSALVTMTMMQAFDALPLNYSEDEALLKMLEAANDRVNDMLKASGSGKSGSTVVAVIVRDMKLHWIAVGDSHIYLYRNGALMQINRDHVYSVVLDEMAARGEISSAQARQDPQRKALTSYIGMGKIEKIDRNIRPLQLRREDRVLLMSDGVFGTLTEEEMAAAMKLPVSESSEALHQMIRQKNKAAQDNYTALILECM